MISLWPKTSPKSVHLAVAGHMLVNVQTKATRYALDTVVRILRSARDMPLNILLIQGDALNAQVVRDALSKSRDSNFHVEWVSTCALGLERLAVLGKQKQQGTRGISAVPVDLLLPDVEGIETFDRLFAAIPQIPIPRQSQFGTFGNE